MSGTDGHCQGNLAAAMHRHGPLRVARRDQWREGSMNRTRLDAIEARAAAATPGPWGWAWDSGELMVGRAGDESGEGHVLTVRICDACEKRSAPCVGGSPEDQAFIAHARTDIPALLAVARAVDDFLRQQRVDAESNRCQCEDAYPWDGIHRSPCLYDVTHALRAALAPLLEPEP